MAASAPDTLLKAQTKPPRANIVGVGVHATDLSGAVEALEQHILEPRKGYVCVTSVHGIMEARRSADFHRILTRASLVVADGMPLVWLARLQKHKVGRVFGPDLMWQLCARSVARKFTHFLYGGKPGVAEDLRANLEKRFPGIRVVGTYTPPFRPLNDAELREVRNIIHKAQPDIIWVSLSTPKQERFMAEMIDGLECKLMVGVGAAFDLHTGRLKDAPEWMKQCGMQWLHRLCQEPRRLWKRYLLNNPGFLWQAGLQLSGMRKYELPCASSSSHPPVVERLHAHVNPRPVSFSDCRDLQ